MGDIGTGIAYLCRTCCCMSDGEVSADGSHFSSRSKPDPRERQIDEEFLARNYRQDSAGRFHVQPTPTSSMFPRVVSEESSNSKKNGSLKAGGDRPLIGVRPEAPLLTTEKSASSDKTNLSNDIEDMGAPILLSSNPTAG
ncbi:hypothetical protein M413DRAFT_31289 [Hebeloma cylindrosporum]|uniref:Uncharacterized protein n=1 Tax=Hebeloma cylindrosporum TaxID=76867 RepID=A0A0C2Y780_HEBCY|nr:hypothetical protein M413DRAFT_31289 [Hebeloma cylindrosporum h7]